MDILEVFSKKLGKKVPVIQTPEGIMIDPDSIGRDASILCADEAPPPDTGGWVAGGWNASSTGWMANGWAAGSDGWIANGWNASGGDRTTISGWNAGKDDWMNGGWANDGK